MRAPAHALAALAALAALPLAASFLLLRPRWRVGWRERLGVHPRVAPGSVWIHAASVGEILAASRLAGPLRERGHALITSTATLTGREVMRRAKPGLPCHLAPLDHPWCVDTALARAAPAALVLVETEIWPAWIASASRRGIPVVLVSGRLSDRSFPRYRLIRRLLGATLGRLHAVGARTEADAERFRALGVPADRVSVTGDLKLDVEDAPPPLAPDLERVLGGAPLVVAGSTHPGEERLILEALERVEARGQRAALVLAPRHPARADEVERELRARRRPVRRRTRLGEAPLDAGSVLLLDTVGELAALYARADVAFVGGTLVPIGGHNVLEPAVAGRPVLVGPHTSNVRHALPILEECGAGRRVADAAELAQALEALLADPEAARASGVRGRQALLRHRGSAERSAALVQSALPPAALA